MTQRTQREKSDAELLLGWGAGDMDAGSELLTRHYDLVHRFFRNKVTVEVEDLCQQTFLACVEARARYQQRSSFTTFLLGIARHKLYKHYRSRRQDALDPLLTSVAELGTSPSGLAAKREDEALLAHALQRVPLAAQVVLELAYWEGMGAKDIGVVLQLPINTVYSRLHRAREQLRERLRELAPDHHIYEATAASFERALDQTFRETVGGPEQ